MNQTVEPTWEDIPLWPHQKAAVQKMRDYLDTNDFASAALVRMPTAAGKSGIIAVLAKCFNDFEAVLVVTPFSALRDQLSKVIETRFWERIKSSNFPKQVKMFVPSELSDALANSGKSCVLICTIQTLYAVYSDPKYAAGYSALKARTQLVMFDEGHRQPAPKWAQAIEDMAKPTVLFTATPYRNDQKFLAVNPRFVYVMTIQQALSGDFVRSVRFIERPSSQSARGFVQALLDYYRNDFQTAVTAAIGRRVIVRCETKDAVDEVQKLLEDAGETAIAIHDDFVDSDADTTHFRTVPDPADEHATFWVHQNKLVEGIDDPRFTLLAIHQPFGNARAVVQQIGRVLRNPDRTPGQIGYVFCRPADGQKDFWDNYLNYEAQADLVGLDHFTDAVQAGYQYFDGNYRQSFDIKDPNAYKYLSYRASTNVFVADKTFTLAELRKHLLLEWACMDRSDLNLQEPDTDTGVCVYSSYRNSPILRDRIFLEFQLGFTVYRLIGSNLYFYDSQGATPDFLREHGRRISPAKLRSLFSNTATIAQVSLTNSDLGKYSVRRRSLHARSIVDTAPSLVDHAHILSTASGSIRDAVNNERVRRYVGFSKARISDNRSRDFNYLDYMKWLTDMEASLSSRGQAPNGLFARFSAYADPPSNVLPVNILLDIDEAEQLFENRSSHQKLQVENLCIDVKNSQFMVSVNDKDYLVKIDYDSRKHHYALSSSDLDQDYLQTELESNAKAESLSSYLTKEQAFRLVVTTPGFVYAHGHFFDVRQGMAGELDLSRVFIAVDKLKTAKSEKGGDNTATVAGWDAGSVFGLVDSSGAGTKMADYMKDVSLMVCDDLSSEIADFIALDEVKQRVIFIHAKAGKGRSTSASVFADVCSQATKNLAYVQPTLPKGPDQNIAKWDTPWTHADIGTVSSRVRLGAVNGAEFWSRATKILRNPDASREVWIVMGNGFSLSKFNKKRAQSKRPPQIIQILYQLTATWSAVSSVGAKLRVFCSP